VTEVLNRLEKTLQKQVADEDLRVISNLVYTEEDIVTIESEFKNLILPMRTKPLEIPSNICRRNIRYASRFTLYGTA